MKRRLGFVSNSSSSSFVVVSEYGYHGKQTLTMTDGKLVLGQIGGNDEFGWSFIEYNDFLSKLNWVCLQADYSKDNRYKEMIESVLKNNIDGIEEIVWELEGSIDHQSKTTGMEQIFKDETSLKNFLFDSESHVRTGNDQLYL